MASKITNIDTNYIIQEYLAGKSNKRLAEEIGVSRQVIYRVLKNAQIHIRNGSESMYIRMAQTSADERKRLTNAANITKRGSHNSSEMLHKRALAHQRRIGKFEQEFIDALDKANISNTPQEPFLSYNLDIGCGNIAVEIHTQSASPLSSKFIKKLMDCVHAGKSMVYVWIDPRKDIVFPECYDKVISIIQRSCRNPSSISQYWVVRGTGEIYASGTFN